MTGRSVVHADQAERRAADAHYLLAQEPGLRQLLDEEGSLLRVEGLIAVERSDGRRVSFAISIRYPGSDPRELPDAYDGDGRFPPAPERHIEDTGRFCLWLPPLAPRERFAQPDGLAFFLGQVREFLRLQLVYERRKQRGTEPPWPGPEWDHGARGYDQWAREVLGGLDVQGLENVLALVRRAPRRRGSSCVCGSGRRYGSCHLEMVSTVRAAWGDPEVRDACLRLRQEVRNDVWSAT